MKNFFLLAVAFLSLALINCSGQPSSRAGRGPQNDSTETGERPSIIIDYRGSNSAMPFPPWLLAFLTEKEAAIEALTEFEDYYVFAAVNTGSNFAALRQWQNGFSPELDFALLIARRIDKRLLLSASSFPDYEYGSYYESIIRAASNHHWTGAEKHDDFWIRRQFTDLIDQEIEEEAGAIPPVTEIYEFYILVKIEKNILVPQINSLLFQTVPSAPLARDQNANVNRVRDRFFDGF